MGLDVRAPAEPAASTEPSPEAPLLRKRGWNEPVNCCRIVQLLPHPLQEAPTTSLLHIAASEALKRTPPGEVRENLATICQHRELMICTMEGGSGCGKSEFVIRLLEHLLLGFIQLALPESQYFHHASQSQHNSSSAALPRIKPEVASQDISVI